MAVGTIQPYSDAVSEVTSVEATQEIAGAAGISFAELLKPYIGTLNIHLKKNSGQHVDVRTDPKRTLLLCLQTLLTVNEGATLDFFARLQVDNDNRFPEPELVAALAVALAPYSLRIRWNGQGSFEGDKYFDIGRSGRQDILLSQVANKEV
jgi:hypothetical protein